MDLKTKLKNFFTLTPKSNDGFTLVELIVVIAILGILGGVGVPAYSGYVTKANKQADISLASDVADALILHYYNTGANSGGFVTLSREGVSIPAADRADEFGTEAMNASFGASWENGLTLKHDWNGSISDASATTIAPTKLLSTTSSLTGVASAVVGSNDPSKATSIICTLLGGDDTMKNELSQYEDSDEYATIATNLMVKYISDEIGSATVDEEGNLTGVDSGPSSIALQYALLYSMANSSDPYAYAAQEKIDAFDAKMLDLSQKEATDSNGTSVMTELGTAMEEMMSDDTLTDAEGNSLTFGSAYDSYMAQNGMTDLVGIIDAMGFVNDVSQKYADENSLSNGELYASDAVQNMLTDYQNANKYGIVVRIDADGIVTILPTDANAFEQ